MRKCRIAWVSLALILAAGAAHGQRTKVKPGINIFSLKDDVEIGRAGAKEAEQQLVVLSDRTVDGYLMRLGLRLASKAPGEKYPYQFKGVNDMSINAFALPGGFLYIHRGTIEAADDEAQLAGVIGHEIAHAALRHGTNQATKATLAQGGLAILGGTLGGKGGAVGAITQLGGGFFANSVLLKYSRDAERQADIIGTQILYDSGYDPRAMAQFFEKLAAEGGRRAPEFFSSHPHPENRAAKVDDEVRKMGGYTRGMKSDSPEFQAVKKYMKSLPAPKPPAAPAGAASAGAGGRPQPPSSKTRPYTGKLLQVEHPENWQVYESDSSVTMAPQGGMVDTGQGQASLAYGWMTAAFAPQQDSRRVDLSAATDQLLKSLARSNPRLRSPRPCESARVDGRDALSCVLENASALGGLETIWLVTVLQSQDLVYFVSVAPQKEFESYLPAFEGVMRSVRLARR